MKRKIELLEDSRIKVSAKQEDGATYAFYLYHQDGIDKYFYSRHSVKYFPRVLQDGTYKIAFYTKNKNGEVSRDDEQITIVNNRILKPKLIKETISYKLDYYDNRSDITFIVFNTKGSRKNSDLFALKYLLARGYNVIGCYQNNDQYQGLSFQEFKTLVSPYLNSKKIYLYGSSLGGYCAIYYSGAVNGTAIAAAPKNTAHPIMIQKFKNVDGFNVGDFKHEDIINNNLSENKIYVIYDNKYLEDKYFFEKFIKPAYPDLIELTCEYSGHEVLYHLNQSKQLDVIINNIVNDRIVEIAPIDTEFTYYYRALYFYEKALNELELCRKNISTPHRFIRDKVINLEKKIL